MINKLFEITICYAEAAYLFCKKQIEEGTQLSDLSMSCTLKISEESFTRDISTLKQDIPDNLNFMSEHVLAYNNITEFLTYFSNSILFRKYTLRSTGREIHIINSMITGGYREIFLSVFKDIEVLFTIIYSNFDNTFKSESPTGCKSFYLNCGFSFGYKVIDIVKEHNNTYILSFDISKFFNNLTWLKTITNNVFQEMFRNTDLPEDKQFLYGLLFNTFVGCITHNGILPTGACYSPVFSNIFMYQFDKNVGNNFYEIIGNEYNDCEYIITRYADDITISSSCENSGIVNIDIAKKLESYLNNIGLHIKYEKTKVFDRTKQNASILGYSLPKINRAYNSSVTVCSSFRSSLMSEIRNINDISMIDSKLLGKINYYVRGTDWYNVFDIISNMGLYTNENKNNHEFKDLIFSIRQEALDFKYIPPSCSFSSNSISYDVINKLYGSVLCENDRIIIKKTKEDDEFLYIKFKIFFFRNINGVRKILHDIMYNRSFTIKINKDKLDKYCRI